MLSLIPTMAPWPLKRQSRFEKVTTIFGYQDSLISANETMFASDNVLYIPTQPMIAIDRAFNQKNLSSMTTAYPAPWAIGDKHIGNNSVASYGYVSTNGGTTRRLVGAASSYGYGALLEFQGWVYEQVNNAWVRHSNPFDLDGTTTPVTLTGDAARNDYWAKNTNCVVGCPSSGDNQPNMYISWTFPTFIGYGMNFEGSLPTHRYIGNNVFFRTTNGNGVLSRLIFVPATQGQPVVLQTFDASEISAMFHIRDYLFFLSKSGVLKASPLPSVIEDQSTNLAAATLYANAIKAAIQSPQAETVETLGTFRWATKWGDDRLAVSAGPIRSMGGYVAVWEVPESTPPIPFTLFAHQHASTTGNNRQIGYQPGSRYYGFGLDPVSTVTQPAGEVVVVCCDWYQKDGNNGYNGFTICLAGADPKVLLAKYRGVRANGKEFIFSSAASPKGTNWPANDGLPTYCRWSWYMTLAGFVNGQTYTIELLPR